MEQTAIVTNIQKFSVHDGPGIRSIVFFKGCPLKCQWCANPENIYPEPELMTHLVKCIHCGLCVDSCRQEAIVVHDGEVDLLKDRCINCGACTKVCATHARVFKGEVMTVEQVRKEIDKDIPFYETSGGGVTFSGGEPLLHANFIIEIAKEYHARKLNVAVETCGCVPWSTFEAVKPWVDYFLFDLKFVDSAKHEKYCGSGNEMILSNLRKLCETNHVVVRIPIIPGINDTEEDLQLLFAFLQEIQDKVKGIHCLPYHNMGISKYEALHQEYLLSEVELPNGDYMENIQKMFEQRGLPVQIGG